MRTRIVASPAPLSSTRSRRKLLWSLGACSMPAMSAMLAAPVLAQTAPPAPTVDNGANGTGKIVSGAIVSSSVVGQSKTVTDTVFTGYNTVGGAGSGGGAGLGGVFFVDSGATLTLNNVSFSGNTVQGGTGGGIGVSSIAPLAKSVSSAVADASAATVFLPSYTAGVDGNGYLSITGFSNSSPNALIGVGAGVSLTGTSGSAATVKTVTIDPNTGAQNVLLNSAYVVPVANTVVAYSPPGNGGVYFVTSNTLPGQLAPGATVYGVNGVTATVKTVTYNNNDDHTIATFTITDPSISLGSPLLLGVAGNSLDVTRFQAAASTQLSNTIIPITQLGGFAVGMTVTGGGVPSGTTVTAVDNVTGKVTLSNQIDLSQVKSIKASFNPLKSNGATAQIELNSVTGLAIGQAVSGTGIASGAQITHIEGNVVTISGGISQAGVNAINAGKLILSIDPVVSLDTTAMTVTLASTAGLATGTLLTGNGVPPNAIITDITGNVVTYVVDATKGNLNKGGSLNGLISVGAVGSDGKNGTAASSFSSKAVDGEGSNGTNGYKGGAGNGAAGGNGGSGGTGSDGTPVNAGLIADNVDNLAQLISDIAEAVSFYTDVPPDIGASLGKLPSIALDSLNLGYSIAQLVDWQIEESKGTVAFGGGGGAGGNGGAGAAYFGGGAGGSGGDGGAGASSITDGGAGGDGGTGGAGGFGAGGGSGGFGGSGGENGQSLDGNDGNGGAAGFGGGVGSSGNSGGGGGSGYGGAIFVRAGGALNITGNALFENNTVLGGSSSNGGQAGGAAGSDLFMMKGSTVTLRPGRGNTITFTGSIADDSAASIANTGIAAGAGAGITIGGGGTVQFFGQDTYTGTTHLQGGTLEADNGMGLNTLSHLSLEGTSTIGAAGGGLSDLNAGVLLTSGRFVRGVGNGPSQISWTGSGGFAATAAGLTVNLGQINGGAGSALNWGAGGFVPNGSTLVFGSAATDATGAVTLLNAINLNGQTGRIAVYDNAGGTGDYAVLAGGVGGGALIVNDAAYAGALYLTGQNALTKITVNNGLVSTTLNGVTGRLSATAGADVLVAGGSLVLGGAERLLTTTVYNGALLATSGQITAGYVANSGTTAFGGPTTTGDITNDGTLLFGGRTTTGAIYNAVNGVAGRTGMIVNSAAVTAASVRNNGTWGLAADLTATAGFENNGTLVVAGTTIAGVETPATRTLKTSAFTGGTAGVVQLGGMNGTVANTLLLDQSGDSTYAGTFIGAGGLTKTGAGTLTLTGASTFAGDLAVAQGTVTLTAANGYTGRSTIANGAKLTLTGAGSIVSSEVIADGLLSIAGTTNGAAIKGLGGSGSVDLGSKGLTLTSAGGTFSGVIGGSGGVTVAGGAETLTGLNSFTGRTTIASGAALILAGNGSIASSSGVTDAGLFSIAGRAGGSTIASLGGTGLVDLGDQRLTLGNAGDTFAGSIMGTGGVTVAGGTQTLSGVNTYTGRTVVAAGAGLAVAGTGALSASAGVSVEGTLDLRAATGDVALRQFDGNAGTVLLGSGRLAITQASGTFSGTISGPGGVAILGGTQTLTGSNSYAGGTSINNATLAVTSDAALGATTGALGISNGVLQANADLTISRTILIAQQGRFDGNGHTLGVTGTVYGQAGNSYDAIVTGGFRLTGILDVAPAGSGFTLQQASTLRGTGSFARAMLVNGTLAPGNSPGTMTFSAPVTIGATGTLSLDIDGTGTGTGAGNYSRLVLGGAGAVFTAGGTLRPVLRGITGSATNAYMPTVGQSFVVVQTPAAIVGSFARIDQPTSGLLAGSRFDATYGNNVTLFVTPADYTNLTPLGVTLTANQAAIGAGLNALRGDAGVRTAPDVNQVLGTVFALRATDIPLLADQLDGAVYNDGLRVAAARSQSFARIVDAQSEMGTRGGGQLWMAGYGQNYSLKSSLDRSTYGLAGGVGMRIGQAAILGIAGGYDKGKLSHVASGDTADVDLTHITLYGNYTRDHAYARFQAGASRVALTSMRAIPQLGTTARGQAGGWGFAGGIEAGYAMSAGGWSLTPALSVRSSQVRLDGFAETGAGPVSLIVDDARFTQVQGVAKLRVARDIKFASGGTLRPQFDLGYFRELGDRSGHTDVTLAGAPATKMRIASVADGRDGVRIGAGLSLATVGGVSLFARGDFDTQSNVRTRSASIGLGYRW